jgi:pimeloyl-[acyl-carrier protein] methyl ester esterase
MARRDAQGRTSVTLFLPGWGALSEVWAPFAHEGDRLGGEIAAGEHVIAWSLGAMQALDAATRIEPDSLTLVGASPQFVLSNNYRHGWPTRTLGRMRERLATEPEAVLDDFLPLMFAPGETPVQPPRERDAQILADGLAFLERYSMLDLAAQINCPVRLLHGGRDAVCPLAGAELLAGALPRAEFTVWPEAGHAPFLTQPDRFRKWLH